MRVALDVTPLYRTTRAEAGVPQVVAGLVSRYRAMDDIDLVLICSPGRLEQTDPSEYGVRVIDGQEVHALDEVPQAWIDVVHLTYDFDACESSRPVGRVLLVHDCRPSLYPSLYPHSGGWQRGALRSLQELGGTIHVMSRVVEDEVRCLGVDMDHIVRTTPVVDVEGRREPVSRLVGKRFALMLGSESAAKNLPAGVGGWRLAKASHGLPETAALVFAGGRGTASETLDAIQVDPRNADLVRLGPVTQGQRLWLLSHATVLMQLSFHEGVGFPALEAARVGTPVIASDIAAHREHLDTRAQFVLLGDLDGLGKSVATIFRSIAPRRKPRPAPPSEAVNAELRRLLTTAMSNARRTT